MNNETLGLLLHAASTTQAQLHLLLLDRSLEKSFLEKLNSLTQATAMYNYNGIFPHPPLTAFSVIRKSIYISPSGFSLDEGQLAPLPRFPSSFPALGGPAFFTRSDATADNQGQELSLAASHLTQVPTQTDLK